VKVSRFLKVAAAVSVAALAFAGCSSNTASTGTKFSAVANETAKDVHIVVMGGAPSDSFWSVVKNGTLDAGLAIENAGGKVTVLSMPNYDNFNADAAKLVDQMLTLNPTAVVIPDWVPDSMNEGIKKLKAAGVIVVLYNSGQHEVENVGAEIYIGSDDYVAGKMAGEAMAAAGKKHVVCVNTLPGLANIEARCKGVKDGVVAAGGASESLNLPSSSFGDATAVTQAVKAAITKDTSIDALVSIGDSDADSITEALAQAGVADKVLHGGINVNAQSLERVKAGTQFFAIDQQGYAQGYYATSYAFQLAAYAISLPVKELLSGPSLINKDNVDKVLAGAKGGRR
jgi:simple sugar transport system substrate-binding protein